MTADLAFAPLSTGRGIFRQLDVMNAAGLRRVPGSPRALFEQEIWDLSGLENAPVVMSTHRKTLDFTAIMNPRWRWVAREYLMARMAPRHPQVALLPRAFRVPLNPNTLWKELKNLTLWFNHLTTAGVTTLEDVRQHHCDAYLAKVSRRASDPGQQLSAGTTASLVRGPIFLEHYAEILSDGYRPGFRPWEGRTADEVAGYIRAGENRTQPVPDDLLRPLLSGCLYLLEKIAPLLASEWEAARSFDLHSKSIKRGIALSDYEILRGSIERRRRDGIPAIQAQASTIGQRLKSGWDPHDPLFHMAWHPFVAEAIGAMGKRNHLEQLRPELERWVSECGLQGPWGRNADRVPRHTDGEPVAWTEPFTRDSLNSAVYAVTSAAYFLTSALSGMRSSELAELAVGCRRHEDRPGGTTRYRLVSRRIKGLAFGGAEEEWVVTEDVHRAIAAAEALTGAGAGQPLFAKQSNSSHKRYTALKTWVNGDQGRRLGLEQIPDGPVNPRALRRTLAMAIAQRPHGLMAAKLHLKHVSVATTEGYVARPGGHQAAFAAEVAAEEEAEHMRLTVEAYEDYRRGVVPSGPGARDLVASFKAVDQALAHHEAGPATVIDDRRAERILKTKAKTLHLGVGNYCWFSDPRKALCLALAGTPDADQPLMGMCDSARCPQATHHANHRSIWADNAENTRTVFLGNPALSSPERAWAQASYDRSARIVREIDAAQNEETDCGA